MPKIIRNFNYIFQILNLIEKLYYIFISFDSKLEVTLGKLYFFLWCFMFVDYSRLQIG